jgi:DNA invertase Pin-like site-specific DNA recombinase
MCIGDLVCSDGPTYHHLHPHDIIEIPSLNKAGISQKASELYEKGHSTKAISRELGIPKTTVRDRLNKAGVELRSHSNSQIQNKKKPRAKSIKTSPYGYCLVDGVLHKDPREQSILKLILKWSEQGQSHCAIARKLNDQNLKPRHAEKWSQPTVGFIIKRHQEQK